MKIYFAALLLTSSLSAQTLHLGQPVDNASSTSSILGETNITVTATTCNTLTSTGCSVGANGAYAKDLLFSGSPSGTVTVTVSIAPGHDKCVANSTGQTLTVSGGAGASVSIPTGTGISGTAAICITTFDGVNYVQVGSSSGGGGVSTFNGRSGTVVSATNDYSFAQLSGTAAAAQLPAATSSAQGAVKTATGTSGNTLAKVASTGQYSDINNSPAALTFVTRGLMSLYLNNEGAGATVLHDTSGANSCSGGPCDITLTGAGTDPVVTGLGANFLQVSAIGGGSQTFLTLPTNAASGWRSFTVGTYLPSTGNGVFSVPTNWSSNQSSSNNNYWSLLINNTGPNFKIMNNGTNNHDFGQNFGMIPGGANTTVAQDSAIGAETHTYTVGDSSDGTTDHIYLNTAEVSYVYGPGVTGAATTVGTFQLGNITALYPAYQTGFPGTITCMAFYSVVLTQTEAQQNNTVCNQIMNNRGINLTAKPNPNSANQIACTGDSIFSNVGSTTPVCNLMSGLNDSFTTNANGLPSWTCSGIQSLVPFREAYLFTQFSPITAAMVECGNNDAQLGFTPQQVADRNVSLAKQLVAAGAKQIFLTTLMSSVGHTTTDSATKDVINPLLREAAQANGWNLIDYGSIAQMSCDGCGSNATYFIDGIHPTNTGKGLMATVMSNAVNEMQGSTLQGGCPTIVTNTYSEAAADGCVRANATSNAVPITLVPCSGYYKPRAVKNMAGSNAVTVLPFSGDLIDGSASAITVTTGSTLILFPRVVDSTGVCHWERASNN